jgi:hypothetical protein
MNKLLVTLALSSLLLAPTKTDGASRTFYIDFFDGSDSNDGLSTNAPWKRSPPMNFFSAAYTNVAGDDFVYRGGVTWDNTCFPFVEKRAGTTTDWREHKSLSNWYVGSSWERAIFNGEYVDLSTRTQVVSALYQPERWKPCQRLDVPVV